MEESNQKRSKLQKLVENMKEKIFATMLIVVKEKKINKWYASFLMLLTWLQLIGYFFILKDKFEWENEHLSNIFNNAFKHLRVVPAIEEHKNVTIYWLIYIVGTGTIMLTMFILGYVVYCAITNTLCFTWLTSLLCELITLIFWPLFTPLMELYIGIFNCNMKKHVIDESIVCYKGVHIFLVVISIFFALFLILFALLSALLFNRIFPTKYDSFSKSEDNIDFLLIFFRVLLVFYSTFFVTDITNWILVILHILISVLLTYHYFYNIPYFDPFTSKFWGCLICNYCWISINTFLMLLFKRNGYLLIVFIGLPIVCGVTCNLRKVRIHQRLIVTEKSKSDREALTQIISVQQLIKEKSLDKAENITLIGIINLHVLECQNIHCPCKKEEDLFDTVTGKFSKRDVGYHNDSIFLKHFIKKLYENALEKFLSSPLLHIAFAFYLFDVMKNVHDAIVQLSMAKKKKPSLQQEFAIYRKKCKIEEYIKAETAFSKDTYKQLTNIIKFEELLLCCQKAIERVATYQGEFWSQVSNQYPDLNILDGIGKKIYETTEEAEKYWNQLCEINPNHTKALGLYGNYMLEIKNHSQVYYELLERAKAGVNKRTLEDQTESSDILFANTTVIVHISGEKESLGSIMKVSQGTSEVFGYNKSEIIGHSINVLMPVLFGKRHDDFLNKFFKTGYKTLFNKEKILYCLHRDGHCFCMKILVKQMPNLDEGIRYVGMIREVKTNYDYILTDHRGVIDSFSLGISSLLNLSASHLKETSINIQILAPDLIDLFNSNEKKKIFKNFHEDRERRLTLIVPKDFLYYVQGNYKKSIAKTSSRKGLMEIKRVKSSLYWTMNINLNKDCGLNNKQFTPQQLFQSIEYKEAVVRKVVKCRMSEMVYGDSHKSMEPLKIKIFKIYSADLKKGGTNEMSSDQAEYYNSSRMSPNEVLHVENVQEDKTEEQQLMELVVNDIKEEKDEIPSRREETKLTEKLPGHIVTSEGEVGAIEQTLPLKIKISADPATGEIRKTVKPRTRNALELNNEQKSTLQFFKNKFNPIKLYKTARKSPIKSKRIRKGHSDNELDINYGLPIINIIRKEEDEKEESTPRISIGLIKGPENFRMKKDDTNSLNLSNEESSEIDLNKNFVESRQENKKTQNKSKIDQNSIRDIIIKQKNTMNNELLENNKLNYNYTHESFIKMTDLKESINVELSSNKNNERPLLYYKVHEIPAPPKDSRVASMIVIPDNIIPPKEKHPSAQSINIHEVLSTLEKTNKNARINNKISKSFLKMSSNNSEMYMNKPRQPQKYKGKILRSYSELESLELIEYNFTEEERKIRKALQAYAREKQKEEKKDTKEIKSKEKGEESESEEEESSEESEKEPKETIKRLPELDFNLSQDVQSSITSESPGYKLRSYYSLRTAVDEHYVPKSIRNMKYIANVVFFIIITTPIVYFVLQNVFYNKIKDNIDNINYSEERIKQLIDINLSVNDMEMISKGYRRYEANESEEDLEDFNFGESEELPITFGALQEKLKLQAEKLKNAQLNLIIKCEKTSKSLSKKVNPTGVILKLLNETDQPVLYPYTMWQGILEMVVAAYRISSMNSSEVNTINNPTIYFLVENSFNNLMLNLDITSYAIMREIYQTKETNITILIIFLCLASVSLAFSIILFVPVVNKMKKNKQEVLELFMYVKKQDANVELNKCRKFLENFQTNQDTEMIVEEVQDEEDEIEIITGKPIKHEKEYGMSKRKFKKLSLNLGITLFQFIFLIAVMEGYFILTYLLSFTFLSKVTSLTEELDLLITRYSANSFLLLVQKVSLYKNYTFTIKNKNAIEYLRQFTEVLYEEEEDLLNKFSKNSDYHSSKYNRDIDNVVFANICRYIKEFRIKVDECESFYQGILKKGIYSTVVKYWDSIRQINHDFLMSSRNTTYQYFYLNSEDMVAANSIQSVYLNISLSFLVDSLNEDINSFFSKEKLHNQIIFGLYFTYLTIVYLCFWIRFLSSMEKELWKTKSILSILNPEIIMNMPEIKAFILRNSSTCYF